MPRETPDLKFEIGHVLFIEMVGYSQLLISQQSEQLETLCRIVRGTEQFRLAEAEGKLLRLPTGDGGALVFRNSLEAPVHCALEISKALREHPELRVRMGIHSGPVNEIADLNEQLNVAGAGINTAQRVMNCGDAGHILLSRHVAEDLAEYPQWRSHLHELGECEVKHGMRLGVFTLYLDEIGNRELPKKFQALDKHRARARRLIVAAALLALAAIVAGVFLILSRADRTRKLTASEKSIAVMPFENLSDDRENTYFADGVQEEILTDLANIADLKVISRTSVMQYRNRAAHNVREIAAQLGVRHLLEGTVQRSGKRVRIRAQLIDTRTDTHSWASSYERDLTDVFAIQSDIAKAIADQLQAKLSPSEKAAIEKPLTTDLAAYDLYLRAQALYAETADQVQAREKLPQVAKLLGEAVARDPQFIVAWCTLARAHGDIYWQGFDHTPARLEMAVAALQSALQLQPDSGEVHLALASYYYHGFRDYERARSELSIAQRSLPNSAEVFEITGYIDRRQGRWEEATRNLLRALELDPRNFGIVQQLILAYELQHRFQDEQRMCDLALSITPGDPYTVVTQAQIPFEERADIRPFQTMLAAMVAKDPKLGPDLDDPEHALCERTPEAAARAMRNYPPEGIGPNGVDYPRAYWEGVIARWQGEETKAQAAFAQARAEVEKLVQEQPDYPAALSLLGMIDAGLGRKEEALREGRRACELLPVAKDSVDGSAFAVNLANIYAWVGEKDLAIEQIAAVERTPNYLTYGMLKRHPYWDPLRGDPRFEKIVDSLAPKARKL
jgi:serine/threonine-protein kinase